MLDDRCWNQIRENFIELLVLNFTSYMLLKFQSTYVVCSASYGSITTFRSGNIKSKLDLDFPPICVSERNIENVRFANFFLFKQTIFYHAPITHSPCLNRIPLKQVSL
jgi:hypothetical protein